MKDSKQVYCTYPGDERMVSLGYMCEQCRKVTYFESDANRCCRLKKAWERFRMKIWVGAE